MKVSIHGTSNSIREGWKEAIYENKDLDITNFSVGACSSGVALCKSLQEKSYEFDINILELSINDGNMFFRGDLSDEHIKQYIDGMFDLMLTANSTVILLLMPERTYVLDPNKKNQIDDYYRKKALEYNIPVIDGYKFIELLRDDFIVDDLLLDKNHLHTNIALALGRVVNNLINFMAEGGIEKKQLDFSSHKFFKYLSAENMVDDVNNLTHVSTRLGTETALVLNKGEVLEVKTNEFLHGMFIDTSNSKAIIKIESSKEMIINAYRGELEGDKPQFLYITLFDGLQCDEVLKISIVDNNTPVDEDSWRPKKVIVENNQLLLFGLLFSEEISNVKKYFILSDDKYEKISVMIESLMINVIKKLINDSFSYKKKKLIIHVGMHKTGSSSIQESLHKYLESEKFKYIDLMGSNHSGPMQILFREDSSKIRSLKRSGISLTKIKKRKKEIQLKLIEEIKHSNIDNFIISGEGLIHLTRDELEKMKVFFVDLFLDIVIVGYIRPYKGFMESAFQQRLKGRMNKFDLNGTIPDYKFRFEKFYKVFGRENIKFWKFDPQNFIDGDVVLDFCSRLEIPFKKEQSQRVNESLSKESVALLFVYRKYGPEYGIGRTVEQEINHIIKELSRIGIHKFKLSPGLVKPIIIKNKDDILWMEERLGESLEESFTYDENDIKSEEELEQLAITSVKELEKLVDKKYIPEGTDTTTVQGVAAVVHALRLSASENITSKTKEEVMNPVVAKIVENLKNEMPNTKINEKVLQRIVMKTLEQVKKVVVESEEQTVNVPKLGRFNKKEIEKDGEKQTKVLFFPSKS